MNVKDTIQFAHAQHKNQKYGKVEFIVHPMLVARHFTEEKLIIIALLHDVVEDNPFSIFSVKALYEPEIVEAVIALSRKEAEGETYTDYIDRLSHNDLAVKVKLADLEENMYSATYMYPGEYDELMERYRPAHELLSKIMKVEEI